jgi:exopolysaccharide biosynthesis polyprenyl glycosylphosphotransferase
MPAQEEGPIMIRRYAAVLRLVLVAADVLLALVVIIGATSLRFRPGSIWPSDIYVGLPNPILAIGVFVALWIGVLWGHGLYHSRARWTNRGELTVAVRATLVMVVITLSSLYVFKLPDVSRKLLIIVFPALGLAVIGLRMAMRRVLVLARDRGRNSRFMLVMGSKARAKAFADLVEGHPELGLVVVGHLAEDSDHDPDLGRPILGRLDELESILHARIIDEVAICLPFSMEEMIEQCALLCEQEGKVVRVPVAPVERILTAGRLESIDGVGVYSLANGPDRALSLMVKRALDLIGSAALLLLLSPILAVLAIATKRSSPGPILFCQERVGLHGRIFRVVKFRSMCDGAEDQLGDLLEQNEISGHAFKLDDDPRTTRVGRFLRRTSLDELPQLINVLRGEMSLVGPRPPLPAEVANYDVWHRRRLSMKPGMTGLWQIAARREPEFDRWVQKDLEYIDRWSLWLDLKIIAGTVPAMLRGDGR